MKSLRPEFVTSLPVSAASGLVIHHGEFFIASDDETHVLHGSPVKGFKSYALWEEDLPEDEKERKKVKPDFESLFLDDDELFVLPSLSRKNRIRGAKVKLSRDGKILSHEVIHLKNLRKKLDELVPDLNLEGGVRKNKKLHLFQRGNGERGVNSVITLDNLDAEDFEARPITLLFIGDVPYTITDATVKDNEIWFLAVAEDTNSTFVDGEILGSAIGKFDEHFRVTQFLTLDLKGKTEGIAFDDKGVVWLVTDDDSREKPSRLFRLTVP